MDGLAESDPRTLRAIAHPIRSVLLYELYARGEATATDLSRAIDQPVNSVSFHLRQLARYGVIEEADGHRDDARTHWWRPTSERGLRFDRASLHQQPGGKGAYDVGMRHFEARWHALVERLFQRRDTGGTEVWQTSDVPMLLTDSEAQEMQRELVAVQMRWSRRGREEAIPETKGATDPDGKRRTYLTLTMVMPHPVDLVQGSAEST